MHASSNSVGQSAPSSAIISHQPTIDTCHPLLCLSILFASTTSLHTQLASSASDSSAVGIFLFLVPLAGSASRLSIPFVYREPFTCTSTTTRLSVTQGNPPHLQKETSGTRQHTVVVGLMKPEVLPGRYYGSISAPSYSMLRTPYPYSPQTCWARS
jgi:membrane-associated HD superfamily phosphohydrolase